MLTILSVGIHLDSTSYGRSLGTMLNGSIQSDMRVDLFVKVAN